MKLSVITINYNNKEGLRSTIDSIRNQTTHNFEYIIIDGGSTDGSVDIIKENEDIVDYWVSERDHGIYEAMNKGVRAAKGEFLQFLNSGDWLNSSDVFKLVLPHLTGEIDLLSGYTVRKTNDGRYFRENAGSPDFMTVVSMFEAPLSHAGSFIRRQLLVNRPYDENYRIVSDWKFFMETSLFDNVRYQHIDLDIAVFDSTGISSCASDRHQIERKMVLDEILPKNLSRDLTSIPSELYRLMRRIPTAYRLQKIIIAVVSMIISAYKLFMPRRVKEVDIPVIEVVNKSQH